MACINSGGITNKLAKNDVLVLPINTAPCPAFFFFARARKGEKSVADNETEWMAVVRTSTRSSFVVVEREKKKKKYVMEPAT